MLLYASILRQHKQRGWIYLEKGHNETNSAISSYTEFISHGWPQLRVHQHCKWSLLGLLVFLSKALQKLLFLLSHTLFTASPCFTHLLPASFSLVTRRKQQQQHCSILELVTDSRLITHKRSVSCMACLPSHGHIVTTGRLWNIQDSAHTKSFRQGDMFTLQHCGKGIYLKSSCGRHSAPTGHNLTRGHSLVTQTGPLCQCVGFHPNHVIFKVVPSLDWHEYCIEAKMELLCVDEHI